MKENPIHIGPDEQLIKMLAGETSDKENQELNLWIQASEENKEYFESLKKTWEAIDEVNPEELQEVDKAWEIFDDRTKTSVRPFWGTLLRVAAVLLVAVAIGGTFFLWNKTADISDLKQIVNTTNEPLMQPLSDGSVIYLKPNASIEYSTSFAQNERHISLEGEAFFEVAKDPERPFVVQTPQTKIEVLGTSFLVKADTEDAETEVIVSTGVVSFTSIDEALDPLKLEAGMGGTFAHDSKKLTKSNQAQVNEASWATKKFIFSKTPVSEVATILSQTFDVEIKLANDELKTCLYTGDFIKGESLHEIILIIDNTDPYDVQKVGDQYIIDGTGCN